MQFPRDEGSHPEFRIEWWYITGWLDEPADPLGFQITFFRARPELKHDNPSAFTPRQIMIAHAALSDPAHGRLIHAQRAARAGFDLAGAEPGRARVWIDDWLLQQNGASYHARIPAREFALELSFGATQPPLKQGRDGFSKKGPAPASASYYYSVPHLKVSGAVARDGKQRLVNGTAWLDHEWSSQYMEKGAVGWDWIGINLDDGGALMAFRLRDAQGAPVWAGGTLRTPDGTTRSFAPHEVRFEPLAWWTSAATRARYAVRWRIACPAGTFELRALVDAQELDARASTGTVYWEGLSELLDSEGKRLGLGYLEMTGYAAPLRL
jgi:predicted secreted hydrolase